MATDVGLPPGFELDPVALPQGFELDQAPAPGGRQIVEPNDLMRRAGIRKNRYKDENLAGNVGSGILSFGQDMGREATLLATGLGAPPNVANATGFAADVGSALLPVGTSSKAAAVAGAPVLEGAAKAGMQSALKPSMKALKLGKADEAITTLLEEGANVSKAGVAKLQGRVDAINAAIADALKGSGATVDKGAVASRLQDVIQRIEAGSMNPQDRVAAVEKIYEQVLANPVLAQKIPVEKAQQIKQGIYKLLKDEYGKLGSDAVESQKALARGLKEEISSAVPAVGPINAEEAKLINALQLAEHRALQTGNKDIGGLSWLSLNPAAWAAFMADRSPAFKSAVANMLYKGREAIPATAAGAVTAGAVTQNKQ